MIYIEFNEENKVTLEHYRPFHTIDGLNKTQQELEETGLLVDSVPEPIQEEGKYPVLMVDPVSRTLYHNYETTPATPEEEENKALKERVQATEDMLLMLMDMQMPM